MPKSSKETASDPIDTAIWPTISIKKDLSVDFIEPEQIFVLNDFLTAQECQALIQFVDGLDMQLTAPPKRGEATRVNHRTSIISSSFAATLFDLLIPHLPAITSFESHTQAQPPPRPVLCNSNIRLYKYTEGQYFGPHYDESVAGPFVPIPASPTPPGINPESSLSPEKGKTGAKKVAQKKSKVPAVAPTPQAKTWSEWTILVYLSGVEDGIIGGETVFYADEGRGKSRTQRSIVPPLRRGSVLLHKHGKECLLHEGRMVQRGTKYVLRSDLMFGRVPMP